MAAISALAVSVRCWTCAGSKQQRAGGSEVSRERHCCCSRAGIGAGFSGLFEVDPGKRPLPPRDARGLPADDDAPDCCFRLSSQWRSSSRRGMLCGATASYAGCCAGYRLPINQEDLPAATWNVCSRRRPSRSICRPVRRYNERHNLGEPMPLCCGRHKQVLARLSRTPEQRLRREVSFCPVSFHHLIPTVLIYRRSAAAQQHCHGNWYLFFDCKDLRRCCNAIIRGIALGGMTARKAALRQRGAEEECSLSGPARA